MRSVNTRVKRPRSVAVLAEASGARHDCPNRRRSAMHTNGVRIRNTSLTGGTSLEVVPADYFRTRLEFLLSVATLTYFIPIAGGAATVGRGHPIALTTERLVIEGPAAREAWSAISAADTVVSCTEHLCGDPS